MGNYAEEFRSILCDVARLEKIAAENPHANGKQLPTKLASSCNAIYENLREHAGPVIDTTVPYAYTAHITNYAMKLAMDLGIQNNLSLAIKLGSAILVDRELCENLKHTTTAPEYEKLAELQIFGREYIVNLLQGAFRV